jgi:serine/threonine protein kinase
MNWADTVLLSNVADVYIKTPTAAGFNTYGSRLGELFVHEAEVYELLKTHPHPNIMGFQGSLVLNGRLRGLCLDKYDQTLAERFESDKPVDIEACVNGIEAGIAHLHRLGLAHNDIRPSNILLKYTDENGDTPVIGDLDVCHPDGTELDLKAGVLGNTQSSFNNDLVAVRNIKRYLRGEIAEP